MNQRPVETYRYFFICTSLQAKAFGLTDGEITDDGVKVCINDEIGKESDL